MELSNWFFIEDDGRTPFPWALRQFKYESTESVVATRQATSEAMSDYVSNHARHMLGNLYGRVSVDFIYSGLLVVTSLDSHQTIVIDVTNL